MFRRVVFEGRPMPVNTVQTPPAAHPQGTAGGYLNLGQQQRSICWLGGLSRSKGVDIVTIMMHLTTTAAPKPLTVCINRSIDHQNTLLKHLSMCQGGSVERHRDHAHGHNRPHRHLPPSAGAQPLSISIPVCRHPSLGLVSTNKNKMPRVRRSFAYNKTCTSMYVL